MSGDIQVKKRKDKRKKKAQLEALAQEEYREERAIFGASRTVRDEFLPVAEEISDRDTQPLVPDVPSEGSNICGKLIFALLLVILGVASGIIFFELGDTDLSLKQAEQYFAPFFNGEPEEEVVINEPVFEERNVPPVEAPRPPEIIEEPEVIEASPRIVEPVDEEQEAPASVETPALPEEEEPASAEEEPDFLPRQVTATVIPTEVVTVVPTAEVEPQPTEESFTEQQAFTVGSEQAEPVPSVTEESVPEPQLTQDDLATPQAEARNKLPEPEQVETTSEVQTKEEDAPVAEQEAEEVAQVEEPVQIPEIAETPEVVPEEAIPVEEVPPLAEETEVTSEAAVPEADIAVEEIPAAQVVEEVAIPEAVAEEPQEATQQVEAVEEEEEVKVSEEQEEPESFANQAEREAVEDAVAELWLMARRVQEEATALRAMSKLESSIAVADRAMQIVEALQERARSVIDTANDGQFEQLLEDVAEIERHLRSLLQSLESARQAEAEEAETTQTEAPVADNEVGVEVPQSKTEEVPPQEENEVEEQPEIVLLEDKPQVVPLEEPRVEEIQATPEEVQTTENVAEDVVRGDQAPEEAVEPEQPVLTPPPQPSVEEKLREADDILDNKSALEALAKYSEILDVNPDHALALYGRARALEKLSSKERSNSRLEQAIFAYRAVLDLEDKVDDALFRKAGEKCVERMRFRGFHGKAMRIQQRLIQRFPDDVELRNQLAVQCLLAGQTDAAKDVLEETLKRWPENGFAKAHYGFVLKTHVLDNKNAIQYLSEGIASREPGVVDGRFYFHLGDALMREGRNEEAMKIYEDGVKEGLFLSKYQRSLYNVDRLTAKPWWSPEETTYASFFKELEAHWEEIRDEGLALLNDQDPPAFQDEAENLRDTGDWKQFELFTRGQKIPNRCKRAPKTCALVETFAPAASCRRGQIKFSIMHPGTHVWAHTGPTNCRIRAHLGLVVPQEGLALRVAEETRTWEEGKFIIFDDSFEHEVWHNGSSYRLVLIVDVWHPELTEQERKTLPAI